MPTAKDLGRPLTEQERLENFAGALSEEVKRSCTCGFIGLRHATTCPTYPLTAEGGFAGAYPPGGGDDDSDHD